MESSLVVGLDNILNKNQPLIILKTNYMASIVFTILHLRKYGPFYVLGFLNYRNVGYPTYTYRLGYRFLCKDK